MSWSWSVIWLAGAGYGVVWAWDVEGLVMVSSGHRMDCVCAGLAVGCALALLGIG
jgi:hypothetical protein